MNSIQKLIKKYGGPRKWSELIKCPLQTAYSHATTGKTPPVWVVSALEDSARLRTGEIRLSCLVCGATKTTKNGVIRKCKCGACSWSIPRA